MGSDQTESRVETPRGARLEIAHVLFTDIVGYSRLPMDQQTKLLRELQEIIRGTVEFKEAQSTEQLISLPTGDGMALVFFGSPEDAVQCAMEIGRALKAQPDLKLRMGVHSGPVYRVADINSQVNVAGDGINMAQRVMDCGDAGHILVSHAVAEMLGQLSGWEGKLHDLGEAEVKHGVRVHLFNLYSEGIGNPEVPQKLRGGQGAGVTPNVTAAATSAVAARVSTNAGRMGGEAKRRRLAIPAAVAALAFGSAAAFSYFYFTNSSPRAITSIAVLPFANAGGDPNTEYLSDGISETLINRLSQLPGMRVIARSSSFRYKGEGIDVRKAAEALGVEAVLTGVVTQRGENLVVSAELINAADGTQMWGQQYSHKGAEALAIQAQIVQEISASLRPKLSVAEGARVTKRHTENPQAYQLYIKGIYFSNKRTVEGLNKAVAQFQQAMDRDPTYPLAYVGLADSYAFLAQYGGLTAVEGFPKAKVLAEKALEIDETLAEAHATLGLVKMDYDLDFRGAEAEFRRAIELNPNYVNARHWNALSLFAAGRLDEAFAEIKRAHELDPLSLPINRNWGRFLWMTRQDDQAIAQLRKTSELEPSFAPVHRDLAIAYYFKKMNEESMAEYLEWLKLTGSSAEEVSSFETKYRTFGWRGVWQRQIERDTERVRQGKIVGSLQFAFNYALLGDKEQALEWLEKAYQDRDGEVLRWIGRDRRVDGLRSDPRFRELVRRIGLPQ